ncbi:MULTISPECIES: tetratricopeptide repeat protein [Bacillaceae]|uniref:Tetratricopeptide repeat protein n=1 Tax=Evansella alkalicola TaxID=745819 RepID=A0ABS6JY11_9BACI|nr:MULTISPECIES: hypothetical protein [Bacillaceae]MBU9723280.1 hypothetical protein [Bacillus alkalicola]
MTKNQLINKTYYRVFVTEYENQQPSETVERVQNQQAVERVSLTELGGRGELVERAQRMQNQHPGQHTDSVQRTKHTQRVESSHPIHLLGHIFFTEQSMEQADLSPIRFAQGEYYYHVKDYEAAIYKWSNVEGELGDWAKKNIGDAYYELGWLRDAEKTYQSIRSKDEVLSIEIALQLASLYAEKNDVERLYLSINKAISINPDYPNVTELGRTIYEQHQDWQNAVVLVVNEAVRTEDTSWFDLLKTYVDKGYTRDFVPDYFQDSLQVLAKVDESRFAQLLKSLNNSYIGQAAFVDWVKTLNDLLLGVEEIEERGPKQDISTVLHHSYLELMTGEYLLNELKTVMPDLLTNWLNAMSGEQALVPATAVMAWNEIFPSTLTIDTLRESEHHLFNNDISFYDSTEEVLTLLEAIMAWADKHTIGEKIKWLSRKLLKASERGNKHLLVTGRKGSGAAETINAILGENLLGDENITMFIEKATGTNTLTEIKNDGVQPVTDMVTLQNNDLVELRWSTPSPLQKLDFSLISIPEMSGGHGQENDIFNYSNVSDGILYVLDDHEVLREGGIPELDQVNHQHVPVHFLIRGERESKATRERIQEFYPNAEVFTLSNITSDMSTGNNLVHFINRNYHIDRENSTQHLISKVLYLIRSALVELLKGRTTAENSFNFNLSFIEELTGKLQGLESSLQDKLKENTLSITEAYRVLKDNTRRNIEVRLPKILQECTQYIKEDSNFREIHIELDNKMNEAIQTYVQDSLIPKFKSDIQNWMNEAERELNETQCYLEEMSETINTSMEEKKVALAGDLQILLDWKRDINRLTYRIEIDKVNIMTRNKPAQMLLKSAGKIFGNLQQNKQILYNQYKKKVENDSYEDVTTSLIEKFFFEFNLFEKTMKSDIALFFEEPLVRVHELITNVQAEKESVKEQLLHLKENPELFYDPLKVFEVRALQCDMLKKVNEDITISYYPMEGK